MSDFLKKNDIARILGMNKSTVRFYEQAGLIEPSIDDNNYRQYSIRELKTLSQINFLRNLDIDVESIENIITSNSINTKALLENKKTDIKKHIKELQKQLENIDTILKFNMSHLDHTQHEVCVFKERYFYKLNSTNGELKDMYKDNSTFFSTHNLELGEWFVQVANSRDFFTEQLPIFTEFIEVKDAKLTKNKSHEKMCIPKGHYLCIDLNLDKGDVLDWDIIQTTIQSLLHDLDLKIRYDKILFVNNDNMNFNFGEDKRLLSIQIPVE